MDLKGRQQIGRMAGACVVLLFRGRCMRDTAAQAAVAVFCLPAGEFVLYYIKQYCAAADNRLRYSAMIACLGEII